MIVALNKNHDNCLLLKMNIMCKQLILLLSILLSACSDNSGKDQPDILSIVFNEENELNIKDSFSCKFIPLETKDESLIQYIKNVEIVDERIFIVNNTNVLVFDTCGKFITKIGGIGEGPGGYILPFKSHIDIEKRVFSILDIKLNKLLHYNLDNYQYISDQKAFNFSDCEWLNDGNIAWVSTVGFDNDKRERYYIKITDKNLKTITYHCKTKFETHYGISAGSIVYKFNEDVFMNIPYLSYIYKISTNKAEPVYNISFGKHKLPSEEWMIDKTSNDANYINELLSTDYISAYNIKETDSFISVIYYAKKANSYMGFYDKKDKKTCKYSFPELLEIDELDGIDAPIGIFNNYFITSISPGSLKSRYVKNDVLRKISKETSEEDNPILCLYKLN